jgi:hypothetical protein
MSPNRLPSCNQRTVTHNSVAIDSPRSSPPRKCNRVFSTTPDLRNHDSRVPFSPSPGKRRRSTTEGTPCTNQTRLREGSPDRPLRTQIFRRSLSPQSNTPMQQKTGQQHPFLEYGTETKERWLRQGARPKAW